MGKKAIYQERALPLSHFGVLLEVALFPGLLLSLTHIKEVTRLKLNRFKPTSAFYLIVFVKVLFAPTFYLLE